MEEMVRQDGGAVLLQLKVVPGSRKEQLAGALGDRLKIKVAAPPEDGRANQAVCALIARRLGIGLKAVTVVTGPTRAEKTVRIEGVSAPSVAQALGIAG